MKSFAEILCEAVPHFDAEIVKDIRIEESWIGSVSYGPFMPDWFEVREAVRKISEGKAYTPSPLLNSNERRIL